MPLANKNLNELKEDNTDGLLGDRELRKKGQILV